MPAKLSAFTSLSSLLFLCSLQIGCATMSRNSGHQAVLIRSVPPGADIEIDGKIAGKTPAYVILERKHHPEPLHLLLNKNGKTEEKEVKLESRYRWGLSFGGGFVLLTAAPIAWGIDHLTGAAWEIQDPPPATFGKAKPVEPPLRTVAIAPPVADSLAFSEIAAKAVLEALEKSQGDTRRILPYNETLPAFLKQRFDFDGEGNKDDRRRVFLDTGADAIAFSHVERAGEEYVLHIELHDAADDKVRDTFEVELKSDDELSRAYGRGRSFLKLLPNTIGVNFSSEEPRYVLANEEIKLVPAGGEQWWQQGLQYLSSVTLTSQPVYRSERGSRWVYSFVPSARVSARNLRATGSQYVDGQVFSRWLVFGGYGAEGGYQFGRHYIYASLIPGFVWSQISWNRDRRDNSVASTNFGAQFELGYLLSITEAWNLRFYTASYCENTQAWSEALSRTAKKEGAPFDQGSANTASIGIVVGYNFEPAARRSYQIYKIKKDRH